MRNLHLTAENLLPAITPPDHKFALKIVNEYDLPLDEISWLIRDVRDSIQDDFSEFMEDSRLKATYQELFASDVEIKGISITTNKGKIDVRSSDSLFEMYFKKSIQKIRRDFKETLNSEVDYLKSLSKGSTFSKIVVYFVGTALNNYQRNNAIFDFIIYFSLGGPVKIEEEYPGSNDDYKHYKNSIVKSRIKKYLKDLNT